MSLRLFHIFFITLSTLLCAGVAWWCDANRVTPVATWSFAVAAIILPIYGRWFLKKTRSLV